MSDIEAALKSPGMDVLDDGKLSATGQEQGTVVDPRKTLWKIDTHLLPILSLIYLFAFLDRSNIGNANIYGLTPDIGLVGSQYNVALCIFFVPYIIFEVFSFTPQSRDCPR